MIEKKPKFDVFTTKSVGDKSYYTRIGVAFPPSPAVFVDRHALCTVPRVRRIAGERRPRHARNCNG